MSNQFFPTNKGDADDVAKSVYGLMSYIKSCEMDVWTKARSAGPFLPEAIPGMVRRLDEYLPTARVAASWFHNGPDFVKEVEEFVEVRKGKTYAFGQACPWCYKK